jgi:hypothetical protein
MQQVKHAQTRALARRLRTEPRFVDAFLEEVRRREPTATVRIRPRTNNSGPRIVVTVEYGDMLEIEQCNGYVLVSSYTSDFPGVQYSTLIIEESITDHTKVQAVQQRWSDISRVGLAELPTVFAERNARLYERVERIRKDRIASMSPVRRWWHLR